MTNGSVTIEAPVGRSESAGHIAPLAGDRQSVSAKHGRQSTFMRAMVLFLGINLILSFWAPINFDRFDFPYKGWAWWTFNDLRNSNEVNNVAILGSSLLVSATNSCDATFLKKSLNLVSYHKASYFDHCLKKQLDGDFNTYNLSAPGQMPSDAYMTLTAMLKTSHRPDVVIYGVAPRDFIDSSLSSPLDTEPFRFLHRLVNLDDVIPMMFRSHWAKLNWLLEKEVYLYGNALDIQMRLHEELEKRLDTLFPPPTGAAAFTYWDRIRLLPRYKAGEIHPLAIVVAPQDPKSPRQFKDNSREYRERYKDPDDTTYSTQFYFLAKLSELCKRERIELIVVNMPITRGNVSILGNYPYMAYINTLRHFSMDNDVPIFDLNDFSRYSRSDFHDGVHLNAWGGKKFFNQLIDIMLSTTRTRSALELAGQRLKRQRSLAGTATPTQFKQLHL